MIMSKTYHLSLAAGLALSLQVISTREPSNPDTSASGSLKTGAWGGNSVVESLEQKN